MTCAHHERCDDFAGVLVWAAAVYASAFVTGAALGWAGTHPCILMQGMLGIPALWVAELGGTDNSG